MASGDQQAMAQLYDQTSALVFGLALRIVGEPSAAEDVVLEVYTQAWRQAGEFDSARGRPTAWLLNMARSRAIDVRRRRGRDRATEPLEAAGQVCCEAPGPEALTAAAERHRFVHRALAQLSAEIHEVIHLAYFGGLSHSDIARRLGQPLGTVKTRIRTGMMQLRAALASLDGPRPATEEDCSK